jgi:hypothetical protein
MPKHYFVQRAKQAIENQSLCFQDIPKDLRGSISD